MNPIIGASLISAGSNLFGGVLGGSDGPSVTKSLKMLDAQRERSFIDARQMPTAMVQGAKAAGLHPSVVFGASGYQPSAPQLVQMSDGGSNWGPSLASMGQDISRAMDANRDFDERKAYRETMSNLDYQASIQQTIDNAEARERQKGLDDANAIHMNLQNEFLRSQINRMNQQTPPPMAPKASGPSHMVLRPKSQAQRRTETDQYDITPTNINSSDSRAPGNTAGPRSPSHTTYRLGGKHLGYNLDLPAGGSMSEALESLGAPASLMHNTAHSTLAAMDRYIHGPRDVPTTPLPPGYRWSWNRPNQSWRAVRMQKGGK